MKQTTKIKILQSQFVSAEYWFILWVSNEDYVHAVVTCNATEDEAVEDTEIKFFFDGRQIGQSLYAGRMDADIALSLLLKAVNLFDGLPVGRSGIIVKPKKIKQ